MSKANFVVHVKHFKLSTGRMTLIMKFYPCWFKFSEIRDFFIEFPWEIVFSAFQAAIYIFI